MDPGEAEGRRPACLVVPLLILLLVPPRWLSPTSRWLCNCCFLLAAIASASLRPTELLPAMAALRIFTVLYTFAHELSHLCVAAALGIHTHQAGKTRSVFGGHNLLSNVSWHQWLAALCPLLPWLSECPHVFVPISSPAHDARIRLGGFVASAALALLSTALASSLGWSPQGVAASLAAWTVALGALTSDVLSAGGPLRAGTFCCGNFGLLVVETAGETLLDFYDALRMMARTTVARGGQSAGIATILRDGRAVRTRFVPTKRGNVADGLLRAFMRSITWNSLLGLWSRGRKRAACRSFIGHTRFATSSKPTTSESHPHRFSPLQTVTVWRVDKAADTWKSSRESFELLVTHNGDFELYPLWGKPRTHQEIGRWLRKVLHMKAEMAGCDSVKVGGVLEFLRTKGVWKHSIRLAHQQISKPSYESVLDGAGVLEEATLNSAAAVCDQAFGRWIQNRTISSREDVADLGSMLASKLSEAKIALPTMAPIMQKAAANFLDNDMKSALTRFMIDAHGSFGITTLCTLDPETVCIASRGQAMSISFSPENGGVLWGSEASALSIPIKLRSKGRPNHKDMSLWFRMLPTFLQKRVYKDADTSLQVASVASNANFRHDLDESGGEVIELKVFTDEKQRALEEKTSAASGVLMREMGRNEAQTRFRPFGVECPHLFLRVCTLSGGVQYMTSERFLKPTSLLDLEGSSVPVPPRRKGEDRVSADISDIPRVLYAIQQDWSDHTSLNRRTASQLFQMIREQVMSRDAERDTRLEVDILIIGMEASLWIAEQFSSDLQGLFPALRVMVVSANKVLGVLSNRRGAHPMTGFSFSSTNVSLKRSIAIAVSHSGQTFPTLHAVHALKHLIGNRVFVLTGQIDSKMAAAVGQAAYEGAPWVGRVWHTYCGWRSAEAITVTPVATHHTLSELLAYLGKRAVRDSEEFRKACQLTMTAVDCEDVKLLNAACVQAAMPAITGFNKDGTPNESVHAKELRKQGRAWALHVIEAPTAWCLGLAYISATVISGYTLFKSVGEACGLQVDSPWVRVLLAADSLFYVFQPLFWCMVLRLLQGRQLTARLGKRTIVIGDVPFVNQLLESYVSKLFALSYSIASVDVHGTNVVDHFVHRFTHRVCRGVLIAVGRPDGRVFSHTKSESWILMALQQAKAIVHLNAPPEIISVGHNPYTSDSVIDAHVVLPRTRPKFLCEVLESVKEIDPMQRLATIGSTNTVKVMDGFQRTATLDPNYKGQAFEFVEFLTKSGLDKSLHDRSLHRTGSERNDLMDRSAGRRLLQSQQQEHQGSDRRAVEASYPLLRQVLTKAEATLGSISPGNDPNGIPTSPRPDSLEPSDGVRRPYGVGVAGGMVGSCSGSDVRLELPPPPAVEEQGEIVQHDPPVHLSGVANWLVRDNRARRCRESNEESWVNASPVHSVGVAHGSLGFVTADALQRSHLPNRGETAAGLPRLAARPMTAVATSSFDGNEQLAADFGELMQSAGEEALREREDEHRGGVLSACFPCLRNRRGSAMGFLERSVHGLSMHGHSMHGHSIHGHSVHGPPETVSELAGPKEMDKVHAMANKGLVELLSKEMRVEVWNENRYASLERYVGFLVLFHAMAKRVASFPGLEFEVARSQSQLRVATTAAPINAFELEREWASDAVKKQGRFLYEQDAAPVDVAMDVSVRGPHEGQTSLFDLL